VDCTLENPALQGAVRLHDSQLRRRPRQEVPVRQPPDVQFALLPYVRLYEQIEAVRAAGGIASAHKRLPER
jgi:hypothetical protein